MKFFDYISGKTFQFAAGCIHGRLIYCTPLLIFLFLLQIGNAHPPDSASGDGKIRIAACQFPVSANIKENATWIERQIREAAADGADLVQFPECALSGYPGVDLESLEDYPWDSLRMATLSIMKLAGELEVWVLLGSIHPLAEGVKPMNTLYVINNSGEIEDRYDKRFCTRGDLKFFSAGDHFVTFEMNGIRCGLLICFDVRFPELYREYCKLNVDLIFQSFYNARQKPGGIHPKIMPVTAQAHAGINHCYLSLTNSSAPNSWPCHLITPDGLIQSKLPPNEPGVLISDIDLSEQFYDASRGLRDKALEGDLSSEEPPDHPRYTDRRGL
jgi:predicted amidohydrolase